MRPRWLVPVTLTLTVIGLLVSAYLTFEHFTGNATLACSVSGPIDCGKVTTSPWSRLFGIPVAVLGLAYFVVLLPFMLPRVWRSPARWVDPARVVLLTAGLGMVAYLVWAELFRIHAICSWCTVVHVVTFALWVAVMFGQSLSGPGDDATGDQLMPE